MRPSPHGKTEILPNNVYWFLLRLLADLRADHPAKQTRIDHHRGSQNPGNVRFTCPRDHKSADQIRGTQPGAPICSFVTRIFYGSGPLAKPTFSTPTPETFFRPSVQVTYAVPVLPVSAAFRATL